MKASRRKVIPGNSKRLVLLLTLLCTTIAGSFACKKRPDNEPKIPPKWVVLKDHRRLLASIIDTTEHGSEIIFFSSNSFFEDIIERYDGGPVTVTWVVPDRREISQEKVDDLLGYFKKKRGKEGSEPGVIELTLEGGVARGRIESIGIEIMNVDTFDATQDEGKLNSTVFADSTFPYPLFRNDVATPMVRLVLSYGARLGRYLSQGGRVFLLDNDRVLPPKYRYFSRYLSEILSNPGMIGKDIPRAWWLRANGEYLESFFQLEDSLQSYLQARKIDAGDPALWYQIAYLQAKTGRGGYGDALKKSYGLDKSFYDGYLEVAIVLAKNDRTDEALSLLEVARKLRPDDPRPSELSRRVRGENFPSKR